ncbi:MAG: PAC2 family protein [Candidatus Poseidonia sp.]|nr:PAC2 family protein [Poseidonia sp.]
MTMRIEWRGPRTTIGEHHVLMVAFPGVGNVGKVAIESIWKLNDAQEIARLHPSGLPPLATLDDDGLLSPPHLSLRLTTTEAGLNVLTLTGPSQPNEPSAQSQMALDLMEFFQQEKVREVLVLTGMMDEPNRKETFMVASSSSHRIDLEGRGVDVRRDEPKGGAIGVSALLASMGPLFGMPSSCVITTTVGSSGDILASQRLIEHLNRWYNLGLSVPNEGNEWLKRRLENIAPSKGEDLVAELSASHDAFYM